jgi:MFS family permease
VTEKESALLPVDSWQFYGFRVLIASFITMVLAIGVHYAFGVFFKSMMTDLGWSRAVTSAAFSISWLVQGTLSIAMGALNDKLGPRVVLTICGVLLGFGYAMMSQVGAVWQLYIFYGLVVGTGLAGVYVPLSSTVARWFLAKRSLVTGILVSGIGIGTLFGPLVANWLITAYDWRSAYIILGVTVVVVVVIAAQFLKRDPSKVGQTPYGAEREEAIKPYINMNALSLKESVHTRQFWLVAGLYFCFGFSFFVVMIHLVNHATDIYISPAAAAAFLSTIGGVSIVGKIVMGGVGDRMGARWIYIICFSMLALSFAWLLRLDSIWMLHFFAVVFGFAYGGCATGQSILVAELFGIRSHGLVTGVVTNGTTIGATLGPLVAGCIFDVTASYQMAWLLCVGLCIIGLILTILVKPVGK